MDDRPSNDERLATAHATLLARMAEVTSGDDWRQLLHVSRSFHRYSPNNQLLLAAQGADGFVASFNTWKTITAVDGKPCSVRKGETAVRVYAPIQSVRRETDPATGDEVEVRGRVSFKLVPVFHQGQLVSPPDLPAQPRLLEGTDPPPEVWDAIAGQITAAGFTVERGPLDGPGGANGVTNHSTRTVIVRDDLAPVQALKTQIHELAHVMLHDETQRQGMTRDRVEVEAESVAFVVLDTLGIDSADYSIPYVANWAAGNLDLVRTTAERVLNAARTITDGLGRSLGVDLNPDPLATPRPAPTIDPTTEPTVAIPPAGSTDRLVAEHLAAGPPSWRHLTAAIPAIEPDRAVDAVNDSTAQASVPVGAGASAKGTAAYLAATGLHSETLARNLLSVVPDSFGERTTSYPAAEIPAPTAITAGDPGQQLIDDLVAAVRSRRGRHRTERSSVAGHWRPSAPDRDVAFGTSQPLAFGAEELIADVIPFRQPTQRTTPLPAPAPPLPPLIGPIA